MSAARIYVVIDRATGAVERYVRATTANAAVRAVFDVEAATTEALWKAMVDGRLDVVDAVVTE